MAYDQAPQNKLQVHLLMAIKSLYCECKISIRINGKQSMARVCLSLFFIIYELDGSAQPSKCVCHDWKMSD